MNRFGIRWATRLVIVVVLTGFYAGPLTSGQANETVGLDWTQIAGGPERPNRLAVSDDDLDVLGTFDFLLDGYVASDRISLDAMPTPSGLLSFSLHPEGGTCALTALDVDQRRVTELAMVPDCRSAADPSFANTGFLLAGYDRTADIIVTCRTAATAEDVFAEAWHPQTGEVKWQSTVIDILGEAGTAFGTTNLLFCRAPLVDPSRGRIVIAVRNSFGSDELVAALSLDDGQVEWRFLVRGHGASARHIVADPLNATGTDVPGYDLTPIGLSASDSGIFVAGDTYFPEDGTAADPVWRPGVIWLSHDGAKLGEYVVPSDSTWQMQAPLWPVADANGAAFVMKDTLITIDPTFEVARSTPIVGGGVLAQEAGPWPPPILAAGRLFLPIQRGVVAIDTAAAEVAWMWPAPSGFQVLAAAMDEADSVYAVLVSLDDRQDGEDDALFSVAADAALARIDVDSGHEVQRIPLQLSVPLDVGYTPVRNTPWKAVSMVPLGDGRVFVTEPAGTGVLLGRATVEPPVDVAVEQPPLPTEPLRITVAAVDGADVERLAIAWGDGRTDVVDDVGIYEHAYSSEGTYVVRVTAARSDGLTWTIRAPALVRTPPQDQTFLEEAFSQERQEATFFILGLAVTILGAAYGIWRHRRHRTSVQAEMAELDRIRQVGVQDAGAGIQRLAAYQRRLSARLRSGALDDARFAVLEIHSDKLLRSLIQRLPIVGEGRAGPAVEAALHAALLDGRLVPDEIEHLRNVLARRTELSRRQRSEFADTLRSWLEAQDADGSTSRAS